MEKIDLTICYVFCFYFAYAYRGELIKNKKITTESNGSILVSDYIHIHNISIRV